MIQYTAVMEKFLIVAMEPGGVSRFLSADGHGRGIDLIAFLDEFCQEQAVLSVTVFLDDSRLSLRTAKLTAPYRPQLYQCTRFRSVMW